MARRRYTDEQRARALNLYREHGLAHASRETGISRGTISAWAHRDGVQTDCTPEKTRAATEAAAAQRAAQAEQRKLNDEQRMQDFARRCLDAADLFLNRAVQSQGDDMADARRAVQNSLDLFASAQRTLAPEPEEVNHAAQHGALASVTRRLAAVPD